MVFVRVAQHGSNALGFEKGVALAVELLLVGKGLRRRCRASRSWCWARREQGRTRRFVRWRSGTGRSGHHDGAFELAFVLLEVLDGSRTDVNNRAADLARRAGRPAGRGQRQRMLHGADNAAAGGATVPGTGDGPGLEMRVGQAVLLKHLHGPGAGLVHLLRTGDARADHVGEVFEIGHQLTVVLDFGHDFLVEREKRIGGSLLRRFLGDCEPGNQQEQANRCGKKRASLLHGWFLQCFGLRSAAGILRQTAHGAQTVCTPGHWTARGGGPVSGKAVCRRREVC